MKHGIILPNWEVGADAGLMVEYAVAAEEAGWDGVFLADHLVFPPIHAWSGVYRDFIDPWITLAGIATRTKTIRLGSWVTPIPRRQPWQFARDLATLDRLSGGRVILGAGLGVQSEHEKFGEESDPKALGQKYDEALEIITLIWSGERFSFAGEHYTIDDVALLPTPIQQPRIPIVIGGLWPNRKPFHRGAQWDGIVPHFPGDGVLPGPDDVVPEEVVRDMVEYYFSLTDEPGDVFLPANPPGSSPEYKDVCEELGVTWLNTRSVDHSGNWNLSMQQIREGPPR